MLDAEGIDKVLLYPTIGIAWEGGVSDPELALAYSRAYNRWIVDFCRTDPSRLYPIAHITLLNPEGAVEEVERARRDGCVGVYLSPDRAARRGKPLDHPAFDPFWAKVSDLAMPIAFHVVAREDMTFSPWARSGTGADGVFLFAFLAVEVMAAFTQMMATGLFEKYPRLQCAVLEAGSNWITAWLDRLDHKVERGGFPTTLKLLPSEYFRRQCVISADPDETLTAPVVAAPRRRLRDLGLGLSAPRRRDGRRRRAARAARVAAARLAEEGARRERDALLRAHLREEA